MQGRQQTLEEIAAEIAATGPFPILELDPNVRKQNVYPHAAIDMLGLFAQTCHKAEAETAFLRLMTAAVEAEPESYKLEEDGSYKQKDETRLAALAILKRHPALLFVKGIVVDHFGRKIFASPYQLLHGAGDVWALKQVHEEIILKIEDEKVRAHMQEQAEAQFKEQFPNCKLPFDAEMGEEALYDERNEMMIAQVIVQLETIAAAISADPCTNGVATLPETTAAVAELCQLFAAKQGEVIKTGLHFPLAIMREIFRVYDAQFDPWTGAQLSFFSREVIGAALAASTAVDGQCCKHGLSKLDMNKGPDRRDGLFCRHPKGIPAELAPISKKLCRTMFVDPYDGESCFLSSAPGYFDWYNKNGLATCSLPCIPRPVPSCRCLVRRYSFFGKLMSSKNFMLGEIMRPASRREDVSMCNLLK